MTPTVVTTCTALLTCDSTFAAAISTWVANKRCPIELGDYLEELGFSAAADCARWCATEPDRPTYALENQKFGPYPETDFVNEPFYWCRKSDNVCLHANEVAAVNCPDHSPSGDDPVAAIVWLLDNWIPRKS